jgi:hypothetical protein
VRGWGGQVVWLKGAAFLRFRGVVWCVLLRVAAKPLFSPLPNASLKKQKAQALADRGGDVGRQRARVRPAAHGGARGARPGAGGVVVVVVLVVVVLLLWPPVALFCLAKQPALCVLGLNHTKLFPQTPSLSNRTTNNTTNNTTKNTINHTNSRSSA